MADNIWAIPLQLTNFNIIVALLGGFISLFGLVSYLLKENYYLSEAREFSPIQLLVTRKPYAGHARRFGSQSIEYLSVIC